MRLERIQAVYSMWPVHDLIISVYIYRAREFLVPEPLTSASLPSLDQTIRCCISAYKKFLCPPWRLFFCAVPPTGQHAA